MQRSRLGAILAIATGLGMLPLMPARAMHDNGYRSCSQALGMYKELSRDQIFSYCGQAYEPQELAVCTVALHRQGMKPQEALDRCYDVRRPQELGQCVTQIKGLVPRGDVQAIANGCGDSILPASYGQCVTGLLWGLAQTRPYGTPKDQTAIPLEGALDACYQVQS